MVHRELYRAMINDLFAPELEDVHLDDLWFQQDDATCHTANETIKLLKEAIDKRIISRQFNTAGLYFVELWEDACLRSLARDD